MLGPDQPASRVLDLASLEENPVWQHIVKFCRERREDHVSSAIVRPELWPEMRGRILELDEVFLRVATLVQAHNERIIEERGE